MSESTNVLAYRVRDALLGKRVPRKERLAANEAFVLLLARLMSERDEARAALMEWEEWAKRGRPRWMRPPGLSIDPGDRFPGLREEASPHD